MSEMHKQYVSGWFFRWVYTKEGWKSNLREDGYGCFWTLNIQRKQVLYYYEHSVQSMDYLLLVLYMPLVTALQKKIQSLKIIMGPFRERIFFVTLRIFFCRYLLHIFSYRKKKPLFTVPKLDTCVPFPIFIYDHITHISNFWIF